MDCPAGSAVLQQIDLVVPRGTLAVVLGNSGSGKTTLLRGIMQVEPCSASPASLVSSYRARGCVRSWQPHHGSEVSMGSVALPCVFDTSGC